MTTVTELLAALPALPKPPEVSKRFGSSWFEYRGEATSENAAWKEYHADRAEFYRIRLALAVALLKEVDSWLDDSAIQQHNYHDLKVKLELALIRLKEGL